MREFRVTPAAERDLEGIWVYTAGQWSEAQAERYTNVLILAFQDLADDPTGVQSTACDDVREGYRRCHIERHVIYFRQTSYGAAIVRILHERMDVPRHLR